MNQRRHVTLVAAGATLLSALPLATVFATWSWFIDAAIVVGAVMGVGLLVRSLRAPVWAPTVAMAAGYLFILTWVFHSGHEFAGLIPSPKTFGHFNALLLDAGTDMRDLGVPVEDREGLLFLSTLGIGGVALLVDLFTVVLRRPALAGLPMLAIYSVPVAVHQDSVNFLSFAAGAAGFLWLLVTDNVDRIRRFGRRFTGDGRDVDIWEPSPLAAAGRRLALVGVVLAIVLPVVIPGSNTGLLDTFGGNGGGGSGPGRGGLGGSSVDLYAMLSGQLNENRTLDMVKVQTNDPNPYYLRFGVAEELTPAGFRSLSPNGSQSASAGLPPPAGPPQVGVTSHPYRAQVQILSLDTSSLPIYLQPTRTEKLDSSWIYDRANQLIYSRRGNARGKRYNFDYVHLDYTPDALRTAKPLEPNDPLQRKYTVVPRIAEVDKKLAPIIAGKLTPYDKVRAIHGYFSSENGFRYSLQTKSGTSGSAIVDFLDNKQGFCEQYSAAMAWLVRAAGIPARVAFGFSRGSNNRSGETWTLTNHNLHAWTEVYFDHFGWVPFDATPGSFVGGVDSSWAPDPNRPQTTPGTTASGDDPRVGSGADSSSSAAPGGGPRNDHGAPGSPGVPIAPTSRWPLWSLLGVAVVLFLLSVPALWRNLLRRRRWPDRLAGPPPVVAAVAPGSREVVVSDDGAHAAGRRRAHAAWEELIDTMIDYRLPVDPAATPRATSEGLVTASALGTRAATGARLLGHAEERARYAREPLDSDELGGSLRAVREAIKHRVSWRTRLRAALLPASVLDRWQIAVSESTARFADAAGRYQETLVRVFNPRRLLRTRGSSTPRPSP
jgi:transglutaminase-like putative cysteine protease